MRPPLHLTLWLIAAPLLSAAPPVESPYLQSFDSGLPAEFTVTLVPKDLNNPESSGTANITAPGGALHCAVASTSDPGDGGPMGYANVGGQSNASATVLVSPTIAGHNFEIRSTVKFNSATSSGGDTSSARFGLVLLSTAADPQAGSCYTLRYVPYGNQAGKLILSKRGDNNTTLTGTLSSATKINFSPGLTGVLDFKATYNGGTATLNGSFQSGAQTITVTGTDTAPPIGSNFGITGQAFPLNVFVPGTPPFTVTADTDFLDFAIDPVQLTAADDQFFIRSAGTSILKVLDNDTGPPKQKLRIKSVTKSPQAMVAISGSAISYKPEKNFSGMDSFTYTIAAGGNLVSQPATVTVSNPFIPVKGNYYQLIRDGTAAIGSIDIKVTAGGAVTGTLLLNGKSYALSGLFEFNLTYGVRLKKKGEDDIDLLLTLSATSGTPKLSGSLMQGGSTYTIAAAPVAVTSLPDALPPGDYTVRFGRDDADTGGPRGQGFARLVVSTSGLLTFTGHLGDDTPFSTTSRLQPDFQAQFFVSLYKAPVGGFAGTLTLQSTGIYTLRGTLAWRKPAQTVTGGTYPGGFTESIELFACPYTDPMRGHTALIYTQPAAARAAIVLGENSAAQTVNASVSLADIVRPDAPNSLKLQLTTARGTGLFSGSFKPTPTANAVPFHGALLQPENAGAGEAATGGLSIPISFTPQ